MIRNFVSYYRLRRRLNHLEQAVHQSEWDRRNRRRLNERLIADFVLGALALAGFGFFLWILLSGAGA